jgi:EAL domain-containing protein (putative c-di-GMP-specific phosphodiesterase class I)
MGVGPRPQTTPPDAADLERAIAGGEIVAHFQPQVDLATGVPAGVEALARWRHPRHGLLPPREFIPPAEACELIAPLTRSILGQALEGARAWEAAGHGLTVSVNVAAASVLTTALIDDVREALQATAVPPGRICLEITETAIMHDPDRAHEVLGGLRALGVSLALDDFGTGYSSLARLQRLPIEEVKIDRSFVADLRGGADLGVLGLIADLGRRLGHRVVAEGVEELGDVPVLAGLGCHLGQGYLFARPMPGEAIAGWLAERAALASGAGPDPAALAGGTGPDLAAGTRAPARGVAGAPVDALPSGGTLSEIAEAGLRMLGERLGLPVGIAWLADDDARLLECHTVWEATPGRSEPLVGASRSMPFAPGVGLPGRVWERGALEIVADVDAHPGIIRHESARAAGLRSAVALPLVAGERVVGVVELWGPRLLEPGPELEEVVAGMSRRLAELVGRRLAERGALEAAETLGALARASREVAAAPGRTALCAAVRDVAGADAVLLWEPTEGGAGLRARHAVGWDGAPPEVSLAGRPSGAAAAFRSGRRIFVPHAGRHAVPAPDLVARLSARSALYLPVRGAAGTLGVFALAWRTPVARLPAATGHALELLADQAALVLAPVGGPSPAPSATAARLA